MTDIPESLCRGLGDHFSFEGSFAAAEIGINFINTAQGS